MPQIPAELMKEALKEALKEWMSEQFAAFGRFSLTAMLSLALSIVFGGFVYIAVRYGSIGR